MTTEQFYYRRIDYQRGKYPGGHSVRCKHCGRSFEEHSDIDLFSNAQVCRKGFPVPLIACTGYDPGNLKKWHRFERRHQENEHWRFLESVYERRTQGEAAWGMYAAHMRVQNHNQQRAELEEKVTRAGSDSARKDAQEKLGNFLKNAQRSANTMYIGSGVGSSDPDDWD